MELKQGNIIRLRCGKWGAVVAFNEDPHNMFVVLDSFICYASVFSDKGKHKNEKYDIVAVYDGSKVTNVKDVYKSRFNAEALGLDAIWTSEETEAQ